MKPSQRAPCLENRLTEYPRACWVYFSEVSLDFFYTFYHKLLGSFSRDHIRFHLAQTSQNFICEIQIHLDFPHELLKIKNLLQHEKIAQESTQIQFYLTNLPKQAFLLSSFRTDFFYSRPEKYLKKLIKILMCLNSSFEHAQAPILKLHLGKAAVQIEHEVENVLGIVIGIKKQSETKEKMAKIVQLLLPNATLLMDSLMHYESFDSSYSLIYFEMRKMRGGPFTFQELKHLRHKLPLMLQNRANSSPESSYFPMNEEAISHEVLRLAQGIKCVEDVPQLMISFQDIKYERIRFNIILIYILKEEDLLENSLASDLPNILIYLPKHKLNLGYLSNKYKKRGLIFDLEIEKDFFTHEDGTYNLIGARAYISKILEERMGTFRDCNGGLLLKQRQQLEKLKERVSVENLGSHSLLEDFVNHLTPPSLQATLPIEMMIDFYQLLKSVSKKKDRDARFIFEQKEGSHWLLLVIKTKNESIVDFLRAQIVSFKTFDKIVGSSEVQTEDGFCICFFETPPHEKNTPSLISRLLLSLSNISTINYEKAKKTFRINFHFGLPLTNNPQIIGDFRSYLVYKALFEGLTRINSLGEVELAAAYGVDISSCATQYTFYLRDIDWSNGEKLTAFHFILAWKKALMPHSGCSRVDIFYPILNAEKIKRGELASSELGVYAQNANTLVVKLSRPHHYFLELLSHPLCSPLYGDLPEPSVFNGPYICSSKKNAKKLRLIRNPFYWDTKNVAIDEINISTINEPDQVFKAFENNELDYIGDPFNPLLLNEKTKIYPKIHQTNTWRPFYVYCNTTYFPLNCREIRRALAISIDRRLISEALKLHSRPLSSLLPHPLSLQKSQLDLYNPSQAISLFEKGLHQLKLNRKDFPNLTLLIVRSEYFKKIADLLHHQWKEVLGITLNIVLSDWEHLYGHFESGRYQLGAMFQTAFYNDPFFYLKIFDDDSNLINFSRWKNPTYHELIAKSELAVDPPERESFLRIAEETLLKEMPVIPIFNQTYHYLLHERVKNFKISKFGYIDLKEVQFGTNG
jgi:oligopeptide transport system substrate-binding protein